MSENYSISIGAGLLDVEYLKESDIRLYDIYERVLKHIESFRINANIFENEESFIKSRKPNNTISIIGDRGVGKTSLMLTLLNELMWNNKKEKIRNQENIILPIVDPEKFNAEKNVLGWIIFYFKEILDGYEEQNRDYCSEKQKAFEQLKEQHQKLQKIYVKSRESSRIEMAGFVSGSSEYIKISEDVIFADMSLDKELDKFINKFVAYVKRYNSENKNPLIFITFDDIDLCPEQGVKIMNTILEYLAHPSIVTLVLGKLDNFKVGIENDLIKKLKVYNLSEEREINEKISKNTTNEILKKGLPPVLRNFIEKLTYEEIMNFIPYGNKGKFRNSFREKLDSLIINDETKMNILDYFDKETGVLFSYLNNNTKTNLLSYIHSIPSYYEKLLPSQPRETINFYFLINELLELKNNKINMQNSNFEWFYALFNYFNANISKEKIGVNYLKEIFYIDKKEKKVVINNRLDSIACYVGKTYEDFYGVLVNNENKYEDGKIRLIRNIEDFITGITKPSHLSRNRMLRNSEYIYRALNITESQNILDGLLRMINTGQGDLRLHPEELKQIFDRYLDYFNDYFYNLDSYVGSSGNMHNSIYNEDEIIFKIKQLYSSIISNLGLIFDDIILITTKLRSNSHSKIPVEIKDIRENIKFIKSEIKEMEAILAKLKAEENKSRIKASEKKVEVYETLKIGQSSLKLYDTYIKQEIDETTGLIIQFLIDLAKGMKLIENGIYSKEISNILSHLDDFRDRPIFGKRVYDASTFLEYFLIYIAGQNTSKIEFLQREIKVLKEEHVQLEKKLNKLREGIEKEENNEKTKIRVVEELSSVADNIESTSKTLKEKEVELRKENKIVKDRIDEIRMSIQNRV